jgi:hypothetical protein
LINCLFAIFSLLPFAPALIDPGRMLVVRDLMRSFFPAKVLWWESIHLFGQLPLWNPFVMGGTPFLADAAYGSWDPLNLVLLCFERHNLAWGFSWLLALHQPFLYWGLTLALKAVGTPRVHAPWIALLICYSAFVLGLVQTFSVYTVFVPLPFLIWSWLAWLKTKQLRFLWLSSLFLGFTVLMASPEFALLYGAILAIMCANSLLKNTIPLLLTAVGAMLFSGPQLFPFIPLLQESRRAIVGPAILDSAFQSFHPIRLIEFFFPQIFGNYVPENNFWGVRFSNGPISMPLLVSVGFGSCLFYLTICYFLRRSNKHTKQLSMAGLLFVFLSFGAYLPWNSYELIQKILLPIRWIRYPEKFAAIGLFIIMLLILAKAPLLIRGLRRLKKMQNFAKFFLSAVGIALGLIALIVTEPSICSSLLLPSFVAFVLAAIIQLKQRQLVRQKHFISLVVLLFFCDVLWGARHYLWDQPTDPIFAQAHLQKLIPRLPPLLENVPFRVSSAKLNKDIASALPLAPKQLDIVGQAAWAQMRLLYPSAPQLWGIYDIANYSGIYPAWRTQWWKDLASRDFARVLDLMSVAYIANSGPEQSIDFLSNPTALPYLKLMSKTKSANTDLTKLLLNEEVKLEKPNQIDSFQTDAKITILQKNYNSLTVAISDLKPQQSFLLLRNEAFAPGWQAQINAGPNINILKANGWAQAILVPAENVLNNNMEITFTYKEPLIYWGLAASTCFMMLGFATWFLNTQRKRSLT